MKGVSEFRNTPNSYSSLSPNEWVYGCKMRSLLPMPDAALDRVQDDDMKRAEAQRFKYFMSCKKEYDRRAKDLPILQPGTKVLYMTLLVQVKALLIQGRFCQLEIQTIKDRILSEWILQAKKCPGIELDSNR